MTAAPAPALRRLRHGCAAMAALFAACFSGDARAVDEKDVSAAATPLPPVHVRERGDDEAAAPEPGRRNVARRNGRQLDESPDLTLEDAIGPMANVSTTYGLTIRGISLFGPNGGNSRVSTVTVDGVSQDNYGQEVGGLSVWDADSVEVFKGPQLTVLGRHALAGAVALKTRDPTDYRDLRGRASLGDPRSRNLAVAGGGPLAGGVLAWRISAEDQRGTDGARNPTRGDDRWDRDDRQTLRGKLRLAPEGAGYRALLTLSEVRRTQGSMWVNATRHRAADRIALADEASLSRNRLGTAALEQTFRGLGIDWTVASAWGRLGDDRVDDVDKTELRQGASSGRHDDGLWSHGVRGRVEAALGGGRKLGGVFGAYWSRRTVDAQSALALPQAQVMTELGLCPSRAACDTSFPSDTLMRFDAVDLAVTNRAFFAEVDYQVDALTITAGLRHDAESQRRRIESTTVGNSAASSGLIGGLRANGLIAPDGTQSHDVDFSALLPKLGLKYRIDPRWTAGFAVQRGYRAGGVNFNTRIGPQPFDSEFTRHYDLSLDGRLGDELFLALNAYRIDWRRQQVDASPDDSGVLITNAGRSRLGGAELELRGRAGRQLELSAAFGAARSRFTEFTSPQGDFSGKQFTLSPRQTASLGATWKPSASLSLHTNVAYEGKTFGNPANDAALVNPSHTLLNAKVSHALGQRARWFVSGLNLLDEDYTVRRSNVADGRQVVQLGRGRTLRAGIEAEF